MRSDTPTATVSAVRADADHRKGEGWTLTLKPGWTVVPGARAGDWAVTRTDP